MNREKSSSHVQPSQASPSAPPERVLPMPSGRRKPREAVKSFFKGFDSVIDHSQHDGDEVSQVSDSQGDHTQVNGVISL